jgi:cytochrome c553
MAQGENLAVNGAWNRDMPACFKCHGANGLGVAPHFPALAGQHAAYTVSQLQAWKAGTRRNDPLNLMKSVADKLSDAEMQAVATYISTLGAGEKSK